MTSEGLMGTAPITWSPSAEEALGRLKGKLFATTREAGAVLRYDLRTIRKAIEEGEIPAVRAGATYRIPVAWIIERAGLGSAEAAARDPRSAA
jgi:excisionase family DNA binding protein